MATNNVTQQSVDPWLVQQYNTNPVAVGPVPTPKPPSATPITTQYPGGQTFSTVTPPSASTGQQTGPSPSSLPAIPNTNVPNPAPSQPNSSGQSYSNQDLINRYKMTGWTDEAAIRADILATGGSRFNNTPVSAAQSAKDAFVQANPNSDYNSYANELDPTQFMDTINQRYNQGMSLISQLEGTANQTYGQDLSQVTEAQKLGEKTIGDSRAAAQDILKQGETEATGRKESAAAAARKLYTEMQQGTQQRFGGMTSAGGAVSELLNREFMANMGDIKKTWSTAMDSIKMKAVDAERDYSTKAMQLQTQVKGWQNDALKAFNDNMAQINQRKDALEAEKANARLGVLQQLRNDTLQIKAAEKSYQQQLDLMREQAKLNLSSQADSVNKTLQDIISKSNQKPSSQYTITGQNGQTITPNMIGQVSRKDELAQTGLVGQVYNPQSSAYLPEWMQQ